MGRKSKAAQDAAGSERAGQQNRQHGSHQASDAQDSASSMRDRLEEAARLQENTKLRESGDVLLKVRPKCTG